MTDRELLQQALDTLKADKDHASYESGVLSTCAAIEERLAQPEPDPVAYGFQNTAVTGSNRWMMLKEEVPTDDQYDGQLWTPLYTAPPKKEWVWLTDDEIFKALNGVDISAVRVPPGFDLFARAIEAKLKEKNGY